MSATSFVPSLTPRIWLRTCALGIGGVAALAALLPNAARALVGGASMLGGQPELAERGVRLAFGATAFALSVAAIFWSPLARGAHLLSARLRALSSTQFLWLAVGGCLAPRCAVALVPYEPAASDASWYHETAASLARGEGFALYGVPTAYRPPGYSFLLWLPYRALGPEPALAWVWGLLSTGLLLWGTHRIGLRLYGEATARWATLLIACYPALVWATGLTMSDLPFTAGVTGVIAWLLSRERLTAGHFLATGCAFGLLTLIRAPGLAFLVPVLFIAWHSRPERGTFLLGGLLLFAGAACPIVGWLLRNHAQFGFLGLDTNAGWNVLIGNHPGATGGYSTSGLSHGLSMQLAEGGKVGEHHARALRFVREHPLEWLSLLPKKLAHLCGPELWAPRGALENSGSTRVFRYMNFALSELAYVGLSSAFVGRLVSFVDPRKRPSRLQWTFALVGGSVCAVTLVTFGLDRYRLPFLPWMAIEAAAFLAGYSKRAGDDGTPAP